MDPVTMRGNGLVLDQPNAADIPRIIGYCQDPEIQRWTTVPVPYAATDAENFVFELVPAGWANNSHLAWSVRLEGDPKIRGHVGLRVADAGSVELGFLVAPDSRGVGLCERACRLVLHYALAPDGLGAERAVWRAAVGNWASWRVAWKLGFQKEGTIRAELLLQGRRYDAWVGTLLVGDPRRPTTPWDGPERWPGTDQPRLGLPPITSA